VFDFPALRAFMTRPDFSLVFDAMHAVTGAYANPLFVGELGGKPVSKA
jgi:phosphoglucomutase